MSKWLYAAALVAILAVAGGIYQAGYNAAWRIAEVETLKTRIETLRQDLDIQRRAAAQSERDMFEMEQERERDEALLETLRKKLAENPRTPFTDAELGILRELASP